ncbi:MAG: DNA-binding protein [Bacillales bacterium]|jgi:predicted transcriptional regulator|nr:DNA-binding protein [Bacillales bacterium]
MEFASNFRDILDSKGLKYTFVAKQCNISNATMTRLLNGGKPEITTALRIGFFLGMHIEEIWYLKESKII